MLQLAVPVLSAGAYTRPKQETPGHSNHTKIAALKTIEAEFTKAHLE